MSMDLARLKQDIVATLDVSSFYLAYCDSDRMKKFDYEGWSNKLLCPLHHDEKTPNFTFNINSGGFACFACGKKGSIFDFWMLKNGYSPSDKPKVVKAIAALANLAGINVDKWKQTKGKAYEDVVDKAKIEKMDATKGRIRKVNKAKQNDLSVKPIKEEVVDKFRNNLDHTHVEYLLRQRGLKAETIKDFEIGFDPAWIYAADQKAQSSKWGYGRITIPVRNENKEIRNIRGYSNKAKKENKMVNLILDKGEVNEKKFGYPPRLFNVNNILGSEIDTIVICEGEFDAMLLYQELRNADLDSWGTVTGTHGVKTFEPDWIDYFKGKKIYICFDCDDEGVMASQSIATEYFLDGIKNGDFEFVKIIKLPLEGSRESNDITDFFIKAGLTIDDFIDICESAKELIPGGINDDEASVEPIEVDNFVSVIFDRKYIDKRVKVPITISGSTSRIYHAVRSYEISYCPITKKDSESVCCHDGLGSKDIPYGHPLFIKCCMSNEESYLKAIANKVCEKKQRCEVNPVNKVVMHEFYAHQVVNRWRAEEVEGRLQNTQELINVPIYVLQPPEGFEIKPINYMATGWIRTHPNTSIVTMFVETLDTLEDEWSSFNSKQQSNIDILTNMRDAYTVDEMINDITDNITRIYESDEILYSVLLAFLSPLEMYFNGEKVKAWINVAIVGDSGTGKSATYIKFSDWLGFGDIFSALSGSRTGLLYALKRRNDEWQISIGAYVRASGKIIAIDETQEMPSEEIKKMAIAMETGHLKIERVASGGYQTKTRTIFILNPKRKNGQAATISEFAYGAECLQNCFSPMFIRRLDFAVFTTGNKEISFYNRRIEQDGEPSITPKMMKTLIFWAWTRKPEDIHWEKEAVDTCLSQATELSKKYGYADTVPLANPQDFRFNLARISTAFAVLSRSFTDDIQGLVVKSEHVLTMAAFIEIIYSSTSCDLDQLSEMCKSRNILDESYGIIKSFFKNRILADKESSNPHARKTFPFIQLLVTLEKVEYINKREICDQLRVSATWFSEKITSLKAHNLIEHAKFGFKRTRKFLLFMKRWRKEDGIADMLNTVFERVSNSLLYSSTMDLPEDIDEESYVVNETDPFD